MISYCHCFRIRAYIAETVVFDNLACFLAEKRVFLLTLMGICVGLGIIESAHVLIYYSLSLNRFDHL